MTTGNCDIPTLPDPVFPFPKRLDTTTIGAVQAAKDAAERTQAHAKACIESAQQVLDISQTIKTGPQGKDLADQARLALTNAQDAYNLAQNALSDTLVVADLSDQVTQSKNSAKSAVQNADDALGVATKQYQIVYAIGYAPYWNAPTVIHLTQAQGESGDGYKSTTWFAGDYSQLNTFIDGETGYHALSIATLVSDPAGGDVDIDQACSNPTKLGSSGETYCPVGTLPIVFYDRFTMPCGVRIDPFLDQGHVVKSLVFGVAGIFDRHTSQDHRQFTDKVFPGSIILVSKKSGLRTLVTFQLLCFAGRKISDSYIQGDQVVTSGRTPLLRQAGRDESHKSLGWRATPLVQSRESGELELRRVLQ